MFDTPPVKSHNGQDSRPQRRHLGDRVVPGGRPRRFHPRIPAAPVIWSGTLCAEMLGAAASLDFETATQLRDEILELEKQLLES